MNKDKGKTVLSTLTNDHLKSWLTFQNKSESMQKNKWDAISNVSLKENGNE